MPESRRLPHLDAVRGAAICLVLVRHAWPELFPAAGFVGVGIFFVLSGYLITALLVREVEATGTVRLSTFFRNRAVRLLPALVLFLTVLSALVVLFDPLGQRDRLVPTLLVALSYTADLPLLPPLHGGTSHMWSLAVEEQFYLLWPLLVVVAVRRGRLGGMIVAALLATAAAGSVVMLASDDQPERLYQLPTTWAVALLAGAAACTWRRRVGPWIATPVGARCAVGAALLLGFLCFVPDAKNRLSTYIVVVPLIALGSAVLVSAAISRGGRAGATVRALAWMGRLSYAAYLWNLLVVVLLAGSDGLSTGWQRAAGIPITVALAVLSRHLVELPADGRWKVVSRPDVPRPRARVQPCQWPADPGATAWNGERTAVLPAGVSRRPARPAVRTGSRSNAAASAGQ